MSRVLHWVPLIGMVVGCGAPAPAPAEPFEPTPDRHVPRPQREERPPEPPDWSQAVLTGNGKVVVAPHFKADYSRPDGTRYSVGFALYTVDGLKHTPGALRFASDQVTGIPSLAAVSADGRRAAVIVSPASDPSSTLTPGRQSPFGTAARKEESTRVNVYDTGTGKLILWDLLGNADYIPLTLGGVSVSLSADGSRAAVGATCRHPDQRGERGNSYGYLAVLGYDSPPTLDHRLDAIDHVCLSPDGTKLVVRGAKVAWDRLDARRNERTPACQVWDVSESKLLSQPNPRQAPRLFSPDRLRVAFVARAPAALSVIDASTASEVASWDVNGAEVGPLAFSPDGRMLVEVSATGLNRWDVSTSRQLEPISPPDALPAETQPRQVAFDGTTRVVVFGLSGRIPLIWEALSRSVLTSSAVAPR